MRRQMKSFINLSLIMLIAIVLAGCAGPELKVAPVTITDNPTSKINQLEEALTDGRSQQINVLAPTWYRQAENYLKKAKSGLTNNDSVGEVLQNVAYGQANLNKAKEYAGIARSAIAEAIKAREMAISAGAASFENDFQQLEDEFVDLTADIENNNLARAKKNQTEVAQGFADLELRAIKEKTLGEVRKQLAAAEELGAKKLTPKTLAAARKALDETDQFITQQRYEREQMQEKANYALFMAYRVGQIMTVSNQVKNMAPEDIALWDESHLQQITKKLNARDLRNESVGLQLQNIVESIASMQEDNRSLKEKAQQDTAAYENKIAQLQSVIDGQRQQIASLEGQSKEVQRERELIAMQEQETKARLEAERHFQQLFKEVQSMFPAGQAEVYKQADNLIIRLKAMQFPVGKEELCVVKYRAQGDPNLRRSGGGHRRAYRQHRLGSDQFAALQGAGGSGASVLYRQRHPA